MELRRLFGQLNVLTEEAVAGTNAQPTPPLPAPGADDGGTDQRLVLQRIAQLLDPCKSEEDRFTVCGYIRTYSCCDSFTHLHTAFCSTQKFVATLAILTAKSDREGKLRCLQTHIPHHHTTRVHASPLIPPRTVAFNVFDYDGDGFISNADAYRVCRVLIPSIPDFQLQRLVDRVLIEADSDRDGTLSFDEFSSVCFPIVSTFSIT